MKLDEIILEKQQLDEVPAGGLGQMAKKVGAKVLNKVPGATAKSKAANLAGQADLGDTANNLHKELNGYLGRIGKKMNQVSGEDVIAFLKTKNHKTKASIPTGTLQKQQINDILMTVSKEAAAGQGGAADDSNADTSAKAGDKNNNGVPDEKEVTFVPNQKVTFINKAGKPVSATVAGKSEDGDESKVSVKGAKGQTFNVSRDKLLDPATNKPFKPGQKPKAATKTTDKSGSIPPEIQQKLDALSPEQKTQLASLL
jgi:hypothetical protein